MGGKGRSIPVNENVVFDTILNVKSSNISYNPITGEFTITQPGNYYITWWVSTNGSGMDTEVRFSLAVDVAGFAAGTSPIVTGQVTGSAFISVLTDPTVVSLKNTSTDIVTLASTTVQANIVILEVSQ